MRQIVEIDYYQSKYFTLGPSSLTLKEMAEKFFENKDNITKIENVVDQGDLPLIKGMTVATSPNEYTSEDELLYAMYERGLRPATLKELLAFGLKYPNAQEKYWVIACGQTMTQDGCKIYGFLRNQIVHIKHHKVETSCCTIDRFLAVNMTEEEKRSQKPEQEVRLKRIEEYRELRRARWENDPRNRPTGTSFRVEEDYD